MGCQKMFSQQLRERGFRLTPQREMILSVMHDVEGFATVEEIYGRVRNLSSSVERSTVYRTLDLLQELNLVACVDPGDGQRRYELLGIHGPHLHLICQSCGQVVGVDPALSRPLAKQLKDQYGFAVDVDHLSLSGLCRECTESRAGAAVP